MALSALDDRTVFLLGTRPCVAGRCYTIERTADGGHTFTRMAAPMGLPTEATTVRIAARPIFIVEKGRAI